MRIAAIVLLLVTGMMPTAATAARASDASAEMVLGWINQYRLRPEPHRVAEAIRAAGRANAFKDPESAGVYVGFLAGVLNANPTRAETIIEKILPLPPDQQWIVVRAIAWSGLPRWKGMLDGFKMHMPSRSTMIGMYLSDKLATLDQLDVTVDDPSFLQRIFSRDEEAKKPKPGKLAPTTDVLDAYWGFYFATGAFEPISKLVTVLPWSTDNDDVERLTLGGMAKYTLATNAARNPELLKMLKWTMRYQEKKTAKVLEEVVLAAETSDSARIRKEAMAAIEDLKRKGPGYKRKIAGWGQVGQGALSLGCIGAAVAGAVVLGLPCVIGGAVSSAALNAWAAQE
jgi:hypothetical protein